MTPKEKADKLCTSFIMHTDIDGDSPNEVRRMAKQCALIAVDEIIEAIPKERASDYLDYWQEVKNEIEQL